METKPILLKKKKQEEKKKKLDITTMGMVCFSIVIMIVLAGLGAYTSSIEEELSNYKWDLKNEIKAHNMTYQELINATNDLQELNNQYSKAVEDLEEANEQLEIYRTGNTYSLRDPTYLEMKNFLEEDKTNENQYNEENYLCIHFARDVIFNAKEQGIRAGAVYIYFESNNGHAIIAFDTIDKGIIYVEPQTDEEVILVKGIQYPSKFEILKSFVVIF
jgi:hypothetical protein